MKRKIITGLISMIIVIGGHAQTKKEDIIPLAPKQFRRPENLQLTNYKYSLNDLKNKFSMYQLPTPGN